MKRTTLIYGLVFVMNISAIHVYGAEQAAAQPKGSFFIEKNQSSIPVERGAFIRYRTEGKVENALIDQFGNPYSSHLALLFLRDRMNQNSDLYVSLLDISDAEFVTIKSLLDKYFMDSMKIESSKSKLICKTYKEAAYGGFRSISEADVLSAEEAIKKENIFTSDQVALLNDFTADVRAKMGDTVAQQLSMYFDNYGRRFSLQNRNSSDTILGVKRIELIDAVCSKN